LRRINPIKAVAEHSDCRDIPIEAFFVGRHIDTISEAAYDQYFLCDEFPH